MSSSVEAMKRCIYHVRHTSLCVPLTKGGVLLHDPGRWFDFDVLVAEIQSHPNLQHVRLFPQQPVTKQVVAVVGDVVSLQNKNAKSPTDILAALRKAECGLVLTVDNLTQFSHGNRAMLEWFALSPFRGTIVARASTLQQLEGLDTVDVTD